MRFLSNKMVGAILAIALTSTLGAAERDVFTLNFGTATEVAPYLKNNVTFATPAEASLDNGFGAIKFVNPSNTDTTMIEIPIDPDLVRGKTVQMEALMRPLDLERPAQHWLGPKLMIFFQTPAEGGNYPDCTKSYGSGAWEKKATYTQIPNDVEKVVLSLGIQNAQGTLYLAGLRLFVIEREGSQGFVPPDQPIPVKTHYRGAMSGNPYYMSDQDIADFAAYGGNLMRYQMLRNDEDLTTEEQYFAWIDNQLAMLDRRLPLFERYGVKIVLDMHCGPGMPQDALLRNILRWDIPSQDMLVHGWERIARHLNGNPVIYGYDLLNEPREDNYTYSPDGGQDWNGLAGRVAQAVRAIDPVTPIVLEPASWGSPEGLKVFEPINVDNVIYSVHFYAPGTFTHQGVLSEWKPVTYPGMIDDRMYDRNTLRERLLCVREFQERYNVPIFIGEFSCAAWAPGGERYLADCISIFEEFGWDWTYHAFREWDGWSFEHVGTSPDHIVKDITNPRAKVILDAFSRNTESGENQ